MSPPNSPTTLPRRLKRAFELIEHGRVSQNPRQSTIYHVTALNNEHAYTVNLLGPTRCNCADASFRHVRCKHFLASLVTHIATLAAHEEQAVRKSPKIARRVICAGCQFEMPATDPCPSCGRLVCDKCFDGISGVYLGCPGGG